MGLTFGRSIENWVKRRRPPSRSSSTRPSDWSLTVLKSNPDGFGVRNRRRQSSASVRGGDANGTRKC